MMFAPRSIGAVVERRAAKLRRPHHERIVEQAPAFQIDEQRGDGLVDIVGQRRVLRDHVAVRVPVVGGAGIDQFDEANAALGQPASDQALPGETLRAAARQAVEGERLVGFRAEIERFGRGASACRTRSRKSGCERPGPGRRRAARACRRLSSARASSSRRCWAGGDARANVAHRLRPRNDERPLMAARQEIGSPTPARRHTG